jgi:hypothetical protein
MRPPRAVVAAAFVLGLGAAQSRAGDRAEPAAPASAGTVGTLLYMDRSDWQRSDHARKIALAADFMRVFCGNPAMPPTDLVICLDGVGDSGPLFARALSCVAAGRIPP